MRRFRPLVLLSLLSALAFTYTISCEVVRYVSPTNGTNNSSCLNSNDSINNPCRNLSFALVGKEISGAQPDYCNISTGPDNLCVYLHDGIHYLSGETQVTNATNVIVKGLRPGGAVVRCRSFPNNVPDQWDDIVLFCSRNITLLDLIFEHCGPFGSGVYAYRVDGLHIQNCAFRNITGVAIQTRETTGVTVRNCTFLDNHNKLPSFHRVDSNDTTSADELNQLGIPSGGISMYSNETTSLEVDNCTFVNNSGNINIPYVQRPVRLKSGGHGGAIYLRLPEANLSNVLIHNSNFDSNIAEINGGAIIFSLNRARKNVFRISKCNFTNNRALVTSGGALTIELSNGTESNLFTIENCYFRQNHAVGGGALSVVVYDFHSGGKEEEQRSTDQIELRNTSFVGNHAVWEGSALGLFSFYSSGEFPYEVKIQDCTFSGNQVSKTEDEAVEIQDRSPQLAAISSFRFPLHFTGTNWLLDNAGGGLSAMGTVVRVNGSLFVHNNTANNGGGIHLEDLCLLLLSPGSILELRNNKALEAGGGLFVSFRNTYTHVVDNDESNRFCFMQYQSPDRKEYPPSQWKNVTINFINNTASSAGAAFYASSVTECIWLDTLTGSNTTTTGTDSPYTIFTPPESASSPFTFSGNHLTSARKLFGQTIKSEAMATDAIHADVKYLLTDITVQPGELLTAQLETLDAFGNNRGTTIEVHIFRESHFQDVTGDTFHMLALRVPSITALASISEIFQNRSELQGTDSLGTRTTARMEITLLMTDVSSVQEFAVAVCHPGYVLEGEVCVCNDSHPDIYRCDGSSRYVYIREGRYAWVHEGSDELNLVSGAPPSFLHCSRQGELPGCLFMFDQVDQQCAEGRTGFLCGSCPAGTAVSLDLQSCSDKCVVGIVVFIIMCVGVVVISLLILAKDVQFPSELRGFIFYAQVIGLVFGPFSNVINTELKGLRHFLNLLSFSVPLPWCVSTTLPTHGVALLGYISPLLALATLIVYTIFAKYVSAVSSRGVTHGLSLLGVFIYKYIADTSFVTVSCRSSAQGFVFLYDGTQSCTAANFLPFFLIGIGVMVLFVIPAPFVLCVLTTKRWQMCDLYHFTDELTKDMREGRGWYAAWDVGRRLLFIILFYAGVYIDSSLVSVLMFLLALFVLMFHCFIKPYKKETSNVVETLLLLNLVLVAAAYLKAPHGQAGSVFVVILTVLPYLYAVGFLIWAAGKKIYSKCGSRVQQCLPERLAATLPALPRPMSETEPAGGISFRTVGRCQDPHGPIKQGGGAESPTGTAGAEGNSDSHKATLRQQSTESLSDLWAPRQRSQEKAEEMLNDTSTDKLFDLGEDDIKEIRRNSFIH